MGERERRKREGASERGREGGREGRREAWREGDKEEGKVAVGDLKRTCRRFASIPEVGELRGLHKIQFMQRMTTFYISRSYHNQCFCMIYLLFGCWSG